MPKRLAPARQPKRASALALAADCRLAQINKLTAQLSKALQQAKPVTLDASGVKQIDAAVLQLLAAFVRERQSKARAVVWHGATLPFANAAERLGLAGVLGVEAA